MSSSVNIEFGYHMIHLIGFTFTTQKKPDTRTLSKVSNYSRLFSAAKKPFLTVRQRRRVCDGVGDERRRIFTDVVGATRVPVVVDQTFWLRRTFVRFTGRRFFRRLRRRDVVRHFFDVFRHLVIRHFVDVFRRFVVRRFVDVVSGGNVDAVEDVVDVAVNIDVVVVDAEVVVNKVGLAVRGEEALPAIFRIEPSQNNQSVSCSLAWGPP